MLWALQKKYKDAVNIFLHNDTASANRLKRDIINSYVRYRINSYEYFLYGFDKNKDKRYRNSFVSDKVKDLTCIKVTGYHKFSELADKWNFYKQTSLYFKRDAIMVDHDTKFVDFVEFALKCQKVFAKPLNATKGEGALVFEIRKKEDAIEAYEKIKQSGLKYIVEQKIEQHPLMAEWNQSSVNTVRVPAFLNKNGFLPFTSIF